MSTAYSVIRELEIPGEENNNRKAYCYTNLETQLCMETKLDFSMKVNHIITHYYCISTEISNQHWNPIDPGVYGSWSKITIKGSFKKMLFLLIFNNTRLFRRFAPIFKLWLYLRVSSLCTKKKVCRFHNSFFLWIFKISPKIKCF